MNVRWTTLAFAFLLAVACGDTQDDSGAEVDADGDGYAEHEDCDDADPAVHPGADELCNQLDDNCDGDVDEDAIDAPTWYADSDGDDYGDPTSSEQACDEPPAFTADNSDCDDHNGDVNPAAEEACDGIDNDCDDEIDEGDAVDAQTWYPDSDGDGFGYAEGAISACEQPEDFVADSTDCNDSDAEVNPDATETWYDGVDQDCDGASDYDQDGDGHDSDDYGGDDCDDERHSCISDCTDADGDGTCDCTVILTEGDSIQDAIDGHLDGSTICVEAGTYYENIDFGGRALTVLGLDGAEATIIDGGGVSSVVVFQSGEGGATNLDGFTLTNGERDRWDDNPRGGGIHISSASPTLSNLIISDNWAYELGGGLYLESANPTLTHMTIMDNMGLMGGGLYLTDSDPILTGVVVSGNWAEEDGNGLYLDSSHPILTNVAIEDNDGGQMGGKGGGMYLVSSDPTMTNVLFSRNSVGSGCYGYGGGLYLDSSSPVLTNVVISRNWADDHCMDSSGGGMVLQGSAPVLTNVTITGNSSTYSDGISGADASVALTNVSVTGDDISCVAGFSYSHSWESSVDSCDSTGTDGNISVDPEYLDTSTSDASEWDLHLGSASQLIDAGDPAILDPDGSTSDIGAYGGPNAATWDLDGDGYPAWWQPGHYDSSTYPALGWDCDDRDPTVHADSGC